MMLGALLCITLICCSPSQFVNGNNQKQAKGRFWVYDNDNGSDNATSHSVKRESSTSGKKNATKSTKKAGDAYHITQPQVDGRGAILAMMRALQQGAIGHLLGAAGDVEAIFAVLTIHHGIALLNLNISKPDAIFTDGFMPPTISIEMPIKAAMSKSFGFEGKNASLLFASTS